MKILLSIKKISFITFAFLLMHTSIQAAATEAPASFWANGPLILMLLSIVMLLVVIIILGRAVSGLIEKDTNEIWKKIKENKKIGMFLILVLSSISGYAQEAAPVEQGQASTGLMFGMDATLFWVMLSVLVFEFLVLLVLSYTLFAFLVKKGLMQSIGSKLPKWMQFQEMLGNNIPLEKDEELLTDHDYDGIQELDNGMPPMLKYIFIITVIAAFAYWINYHVIEASPLPLQEYEIELEQAALAKEAYLKKAGNAVDENNVVLSTEPSVLSAGEKIYATNCVACHGDKGQGGVGPNFTDNYWLHGGDVKSVFKIIKYGVAAKGMRSWQSEIKPGDMQAVSSYILNKLAGTNVAGGKAPQGEAFVAQSDSVNVVKESTVVSAVDTVKK